MNPSGQPFPSQFGGAPPPPSGDAAAREQLNVPSIILMIFAGLGIASALVGMVGGGGDPEQIGRLMNDPNFPAGAKSALMFMVGPGAKLINLLSAALSGFVIFGALQMRNLKSHGLAVAACVVAMLPCGNCCCITMPVGIWALTILLKPEVKSAFT